MLPPLQQHQGRPHAGRDGLGTPLHAGHAPGAELGGARIRATAPAVGRVPRQRRLIRRDIDADVPYGGTSPETPDLRDLTRSQPTPGRTAASGGIRRFRTCTVKTRTTPTSARALSGERPIVAAPVAPLRSPLAARARRERWRRPSRLPPPVRRPSETRPAR